MAINKEIVRMKYCLGIAKKLSSIFVSRSGIVS